MALNMFKKKNKFPSEEKEEVLNDLPDLPELSDNDFDIEGPSRLPELPDLEPPRMPPPAHHHSSQLERFKTGFRSPGELRPPAPSSELEGPSMALPPPPPPPETLPPYEYGEPLAMPKPRHMMLEPSFERVSAPRPKVTRSPHMFIRVDKYKEILGSLDKLKSRIVETKRDLEEMDRIDRDERSKLKESAEVVLEIESLLRFLEETVTSPQD